MGLPDTHLLFLVNFLFYMCFGIVAPVLTNHILTLGGSHVTVGILASTTFVGGNVSREFIACFEHSKKFVLYFSLLVASATHLVMIFTSSHWTVIFLRFVYSLVGNVDHYSKELIDSAEEDETIRSNFRTMTDFVKAGGIALGAVIGGHIFDRSQDFASNAMIGTASILIAVLVVDRVTVDTIVTQRSCTFKTLPRQFVRRVKQMKYADYRSNWDSVLLYVTYLTTFIIFFTRFSYLIRHNYDSGSIVIGYTVAYQTLLICASEHMTPILLSYKEDRMERMRLFENCVLICAVTMVGLYYAPSYECYLIMFAPMGFTYTLVSSLLGEDILDFKKDEALYQGIETLAVLTGIFVPVVFGIICALFGGAAFKVLSLFPPAVSLFLINRHFLNRR